MLLHAFFTRCLAEAVLADAAQARRDVALPTRMSMCFGLGRHDGAVQALGRRRGRAAGMAQEASGLRALRPELARIADGIGPLELQALFAAAMLAADPVTSGACYVDDHFVLCAGAKPVAKGRDDKRGRAARGRVDTHVTVHDGGRCASCPGRRPG